MHGPSLATWIVAASLGFAQPTQADAQGALEAARLRLDRSEGAAAVSLLEDALPTAASDKEAVLVLLRKAYDLAARQADQGGWAREAETYRENLRIIGRNARTPAPAPAPAPIDLPTPTPAPAPEEPTPAPAPAPEPIDLPAPTPATRPEPMPPLEPDVVPAAAPKAEPLPDEPATPSAPPSGELFPLPPQAPAASLAAGDSAFGANNFPEAGLVYAALARDGKLPENRRDHWAYCRSIEVARRINAHPKTEQEWASIDAEIEQIRALNPQNWLGEYLRNRASERLATRKKVKPGKTVVRGAQPEEPPLVDRQARPSATSPTAPAARPAAPARSAAAANPGGARIGSANGNWSWQRRDTANFQIYHADPKLADQVAQIAESVRREQTKHWTGAYPKANWQPACEIYLYPTAAQFAQMTGQPEESPGFSTMGMNEGRITARRVNLRVDHPGLLMAVLPHEVTHVILADLFPAQQIPRWADEGTAVLSEPTVEQDRRAADLDGPLGKNVLFKVETLMGMDYPDNRYWALYYAQSVSLTRFLVEQGSPAQLIQFLQGAQRHGYEPELKRVYNIDGFADLQARWVQYARANLNERTARMPAPDAKVR